MKASRGNQHVEGLLIKMEDFLRSIDPGLVQYQKELMAHAVTNENTLRFLRPNEVNDMPIPNVYKRMLIEKIVSLQTPDTKRKLKVESFELEKSAEKLAPKRLRYNNEGTEDERISSPTGRPKTGPLPGKPSTTMQQEIDRLKEERDCLQCVIAQKKDELGNLKASPVSPKALPIPGLPAINVVCDNCHHRGHRVCGNRGGQKCPYVQCSGYHYCGLESKHKEHRQEVAEVMYKLLYKILFFAVENFPYHLLSAEYLSSFKLIRRNQSYNQFIWVVLNYQFHGRYMYASDVPHPLFRDSNNYVDLSDTYI
jgi:hypothetical protein